MPARRILPDKTMLRHYVELGMTHQEIADLVASQTGKRVGRTAVSVALHRAGLTERAPRYREYIPWRVKMEHITAYPLRMLRLMGRQASGTQPNPWEQYNLDLFLNRLQERSEIIGYSTELGVLRIDASMKDHVGPAPIRVAPLAAVSFPLASKEVAS